MKRTEMQSQLGLKHEDHFREAYLVPVLKAGLMEMTISDKPNSRLQKRECVSPENVSARAF
jgi:ATP-dependent DNA helicase RecG